jgi:phosphoglycolate phosphatase-like HAD superfamily hydrolase
MRRVVLWDVDGTLIRAGEIGAVVFDRAIERAMGLAPATRVSMSGKTDPQIVREYLELMEIDNADHHLPAVLGHLEAELAAAASTIAADGKVLPGVSEVLARLADDPLVLQSLLTGNIAPNAVVKVAAFGLQRWLDLEVGAYGSDHADRTQLVPVALSRMARLRGEDVKPDQVWVVGDTEHDLACARAAGAHCLLVATGRFSYAELSGLDADAVMEDLADTDAVVDLLTAT